MKVKDLELEDYRGIKIKTPKGDEMYLYSFWDYSNEGGAAGVWLKTSMETTQIIPYTDIKTVREILEWGVIEE